MNNTLSRLSLSKKTALITGAGGTLGSSMAHALRELGANVILFENDKKRLDTVFESLKKIPGTAKIKPIKNNLTKNSELDEAVQNIEKEFDKLDIIVNCAALVGDSNLKGWATPFEDQELDTWKLAFDVNLTPVFYLTKICLKLLRRSDAASIINIASIYGFAGQKPSMYEGMEYMTPAAYAASKGGMIQLTRYLASILGPKIRVNCISPGGIQSDNQKQGFIDKYSELTPLKRMGRCADIDGACVFLATDLSSYVTGQNIVVDGGWSL